MTLTLTPLAKADAPAIEDVLDAAFGTDRHARTAYRLRDGVAWLPELSFAAWHGERLAGTLQSWPVALATPAGEEELVMVGPVAVLPELQGQGVGKALMDRLIADAPDVMMMIGDPDYYARWDFTAERTAGWRIEAGPYEQHRLLARLCRDVAREGVLTIPARHAGESGSPATRVAA